MAKKKNIKNELKPPQIKLIEKENVPTFYANYVECRVSNEEVVLTFARRKYDNPTNEAEALNRVYISVSHFLRLTKLLNDQTKKMVEMRILPKEVVKDVI